jgi:hypothetical protein
MKYLFTFLAGASFMSACVIASNSQPGWMFAFGAIMASVVILVSRRSLRPIFRSGWGRGWAVAVGSGTGTTASVSRCRSPLQREWAEDTRATREVGSSPTVRAPQLPSRERLRTATR